MRNASRRNRFRSARAGARKGTPALTRSRLAAFFERARDERRVHLTSFDPAKHTVERVAQIVALAMELGTDGFFLGGSTGVDHAMVEAYANTIRQMIDARFPTGDKPPLLLFPSSASTGVADGADGVLFHSLLNSNDVRYLIREQAKAAPYLPACGLEPIGCGMIMVAPGGTAGRIGHADLVAREDWAAAVGYAAAAAAFGFSTVYLNAGSGSAEPVPETMIRAVAQAVKAPLIVGGGLVDAAKVETAVNAGADAVITGTAIEQDGDLEPRLRAIVAAVHGVAPRGLAGESA
jgi:phosphoglycerol geranylgeranyltransferase